MCGSTLPPEPRSCASMTAPRSRARSTNPLRESAMSAWRWATAGRFGFVEWNPRAIRSQTLQRHRRIDHHRRSALQRFAEFDVGFLSGEFLSDPADELAVLQVAVEILARADG